MKYLNKIQLTIYMPILFFICLQSSAIFSQQNYSDQKVMKLKSLKITHQIDLSKIFKPLPMPVKEKLKADIAALSKQATSVQLVGTLIFGDHKLAWLKVENQVYQLESGQSVPGMHKHISQINPESVVLTQAQPCKVADSCQSSLTLTIRDVLF